MVYLSIYPYKSELIFTSRTHIKKNIDFNNKTQYENKLY